MYQTYHFRKQLQERVGKSWDELIAEYDHEVYEAGEHSPHRIVRKKMARYKDQAFIVFPKANLFCARAANGTLVTAMYLDGKWGYKDKPYDPDEHYGRR